MKTKLKVPAVDLMTGVALAHWITGASLLVDGGVMTHQIF
jgi:hypothetical protein